jgi:hypothetical protein
MRDNAIFLGLRSYVTGHVVIWDISTTCNEKDQSYCKYISEQATAPRLLLPPFRKLLRVISPLPCTTTKAVNSTIIHLMSPPLHPTRSFRKLFLTPNIKAANENYVRVALEYPSAISWCLTVLCCGLYRDGLNENCDTTGGLFRFGL